jgi:hypothetical protein
MKRMHSLHQSPSGALLLPASRASENIELRLNPDQQIEGHDTLSINENLRASEISEGNDNTPRLASHESVSQTSSAEALNSQANQTVSANALDEGHEIPSINKWIGSTVAVLAIISAGIFFALQYRLAIVANTLSLEESCRSHPVCMRLR